MGAAGAPRPDVPDTWIQSLCGNRQVDPLERCDGTNLNGATCNSLGYRGGGELRCNATTCQYDTIRCVMSAPDAEESPDPEGIDPGGIIIGDDGGV
jgi:hypothetical protein